MSDGILMAYAAIGTMATGIVYLGSLVAMKKIRDPKKPKKDKKKSTSGYESSDEDSDSDEEETESLTFDDAKAFPVLASGALLGLYLVIKYLKQEYIAYVTNAYISFTGTLALTKLLSLFTKYTVPLKLEPYRFSLKRCGKDLFKLKFDYVHIINFVLSILMVIYYFLTRNWVANNFFGVSFSMSALQLIQLDSFFTGVALLAGLFFYDIFWVFGTDVMLTVATKFEAPAKLLWPKSFAPLITGEKLSFTMLGLGDIVIPGVYISLCLAYDRHIAIEAAKNKKGEEQRLKLLYKNPLAVSFPKPYFYAGITAYIAGLATTIFVMHTFKAAQPALLYLSPACILAPILVALHKGEFQAWYKFENQSANTEKKEEVKDEEASSSSTATKKETIRRRKI